MADFFAVRDEIAEKLTEITAFKKIYTPRNSLRETELSQVTPSAHVNFVRITADDSAGRGRANLIGMQWAVSVACRNAQSQLDNGNAVNDEAGALLVEVIQLLSGWQPTSSRVALQLVQVNESFSTGFTYLTAIFSSSQFIQSN